MSENIIDKQIVIKLNKLWQAYEVMTVRDAFTFLCSEANGEKPGFAIDYETETDEQGNHSLVYTNTVSLDEWMALPVRPQDLSVGIGYDKATGLPRQVRVPLIVICANYAKVPEKSPRVSAGTIRERDAGICQYTGRKLARDEGNLDHVQPRSRGGRDSFENLVWADKRINSLKGDRTPEEAGLKLIRAPKAPKKTVKILRAEDARHPSQRPFLI